MTKLKLSPLPDDKPVKVTVELPAPLHRDLVAYAEVLARESGQPAADPVRLIVPHAGAFHRHGSRFRKGTAGSRTDHKNMSLSWHMCVARAKNSTQLPVFHDGDMLTIKHPATRHVLRHASLKPSATKHT